MAITLASMMKLPAASAVKLVQAGHLPECTVDEFLQLHEDVQAAMTAKGYAPGGESAAEDGPAGDDGEAATETEEAKPAPKKPVGRPANHPSTAKPKPPVNNAPAAGKSSAAPPVVAAPEGQLKTKADAVAALYHAFETARAFGVPCELKLT